MQLVLAIESISSKIILILGGIDKNDSDFKILEKYKDKIIHIISYGIKKSYKR